MNNADEEVRKAEMDIVDAHVFELRKHFDSVQIFVNKVTKLEDMMIGRDIDNTLSLSRGSGNFFSRYGQVKMFVKYHEEIEKESAREK